MSDADPCSLPASVCGRTNKMCHPIVRPHRPHGVDHRRRGRRSASAISRGLWCDARDGTIFPLRKATDEGYQHIRRDRIKLSEEGDCHITAVMPTTKGHRLRVNCPPGVLPDPPEHVNVRLDARGRLHLDSTEAEATGWEGGKTMPGREQCRQLSLPVLVGPYLPHYVVDFDIMMKDDLSKPDFKVGSLWLGTASWVLDDGELGSRAEVLPHLRQGNALVVYSTDRDSVLRWQIEGGDKAVKIPDRLPSVFGLEGAQEAPMIEFLLFCLLRSLASRGRLD